MAPTKKQKLLSKTIWNKDKTEFKVINWVRMDQETAMNKAVVACLKNSKVVYCTLHQSDATKRALKKILKKHPDSSEIIQKIVAQLFYQKSSPIKMQEKPMAEQTIGFIIQRNFRKSKDWKKYQSIYEKAIRYIIKSAQPRIISVVQYRKLRNPHLDTPIDTSTNISESTHSKLRRILDFKSTDIHLLADVLREVQEDQEVDIVRAISKEGNYRLSSRRAATMNKSEYPLTIDQWQAKTAKEKAHILDKINSIPKKTIEEIDKIKDKQKLALRKEHEKLKKKFKEEIEEMLSSSMDEIESDEETDISIDEEELEIEETSTKDSTAFTSEVQPSSDPFNPQISSDEQPPRKKRKEKDIMKKRITSKQGLTIVERPLAKKKKQSHGVQSERTKQKGKKKQRGKFMVDDDFFANSVFGKMSKKKEEEKRRKK